MKLPNEQIKGRYSFYDFSEDYVNTSGSSTYTLGLNGSITTGGGLTSHS